jgi:predicted RNase H-like nuclease (RuvC/YqgF family)
MKMKLKMVCNNIKNFFNNTVQFATLKQEIKYLRKELEESKNKEKPYIDKISNLKSDNRVLKIINTKLEKKNQQLKETVERLEKNSLFKE